MMNLNFLPIYFVIIIFSSALVKAQDQYSISACNSSTKSHRFVGDRLRLPLPKNAILKKGQDVDYTNYSIGFGKNINRVWLSGISGPNATSGQVSYKQLSVSTNIVQRNWKFGEFEGIDATGKLANGNYWRYFGQFGEAIQYYDVTAEAAVYFDNIIDNLCYREWKR